jgi:hypothetical protein
VNDALIEIAAELSAFKRFEDGEGAGAGRRSE